MTWGAVRYHNIWLETIINFLYFLQVSPFRFKYNDNRAKYKLKTGMCSKFLCFCIHLLGVIITIVGLRNWTASQGLKNPRCVFHVVVSYSRFIIYYALLFTLWCRRSHFEDFFTSTSALSRLSFSTKAYSTSASRAQCIAWFLCALMIPSSIAIEILDYTGTSGFYQYILATFSKAGGPQQFQEMIGFQQPETKMITDPVNTPLALFQVSPNFTFPPPNPPHPPPPQLSVATIIFTTFFDIMKLYIRLCNHVALLFSILAAITFYQAANTFMDSVSNDRNQDKVR